MKEKQYVKAEGELMKHRRAITPELLQQIEELASSIQYGSINLIFQNGNLIQIEKIEKIRIPKSRD